MANVIPPGKIGVVEITLPAEEQLIRLNPNQKFFNVGVYLHPIIRVKSNLNERRRCLVEIYMNTIDGEKLILSYPVGTISGGGTFMDPYQEFTFYLPNHNIIEVCLQEQGIPLSIFGERTISARVRIDPDYFIPNLPFEHDCPPASCNFSVVQSEPYNARCKNPDGAPGEIYCAGTTKFVCSPVGRWGEVSWLLSESNSPECGFVKPSASFTATVMSDTAPFIVKFKDTSTTSPTSWLWDFGDGGTSTEQNPTHTYTNGGTYVVTLQASNQSGMDTAQVTLNLAKSCVSPYGKAGATTCIGYDRATCVDGVWTITEEKVRDCGYPAPTAAFVASPKTGVAPVTITFTDISSPTPTSWLWDFGDGMTSVLQNPSHTYTEGGDYRVTLTASNHIGSDTATLTIPIRAPGEPGTSDEQGISGSNLVLPILGAVAVVAVGAALVSSLKGKGKGNSKK